MGDNGGRPAKALESSLGLATSKSDLDGIERCSELETSSATEYLPEETEKILNVKWGSTTTALSFSPVDFATFTILDLRRKIEEELDVPQDRQTLLGVTSTATGATPSNDDLLPELIFKKPGHLMLVGTTRAKTFVDASNRDDLPEVIDDFDYEDALTDAQYDFAIRSDETHLKRLRRAKDITDFRVLRPPRPNKGLLVLDLDYTLLDGKSGGHSVDELKRPYLDTFLNIAYQHFDMVVWSQTQWKWVEMKCTELGLLTSTKYGLCFALDRSSMFSIRGRQKDGSLKAHEVKALEIIWSRFPNWGPHNTVHVDDLARNFAFNPRNGVKVSSYRRSQHATDSELLSLASYISWLSSIPDISRVNHSSWKKRVLSGTLISGVID